MKTVRRLRIRGQRWRLVIGRPPENLCSALCDYNTRTIYIRPTNTPEERVACMIHEVLHACFPDLEENAIIEAEFALMNGLCLVAPAD